MAIDMLAVFEEFTEILRRWAEERGNENLWPSEDTICSFIAAGLMRKGCAPHFIELEVPHPELEKNQGMSKNVDLRVREAGKPLWIEVKLEKKAPKSIPFKMTDRYLDLVKDFVRVALLKNAQRFVVCVAPSQVGGELTELFPCNSVVTITKQTPFERPQNEKLSQLVEIIDRLPEGKLQILSRRERTLAQISCHLYEVFPQSIRAW